jgi:hypothetical protein
MKGGPFKKPAFTYYHTPKLILLALRHKIEVGKLIKVLIECLLKIANWMNGKIQL